MAGGGTLRSVIMPDGTLVFPTGGQPYEVTYINAAGTALDTDPTFYYDQPNTTLYTPFISGTMLKTDTSGFYAGDWTNSYNGMVIYADTSYQVGFGDINNIGFGTQFYMDDSSGAILYSYVGTNAQVFTSKALYLQNNSRLNIASTANSTVDGDFWHDSRQYQYAAFTSGIKQMLTGNIFTQTADAVITNTVTEKTIIGSGIGTLTLPADFFVIGKSVKFEIRGYHSSTASPNITIKFKLGSTTVATTGAMASGNGSNDGFVIMGIITCRATGSSGTVAASGEYLELHTNGTRKGVIQTGTTTINTTTSQVLDCTVTWGTAAAGNTITSQVSTFEIIN